MGFLSNLFGGGQAKAAEKAAKIQAGIAGENRALGEQYTTASLGDLDSALASALGEMSGGTDAAKEYLSPYADAGTKSLSQIMDLMGLNGPEAAQAAKANFTTTPGYEFRVGEGVKALDRSASAQGGLYSGAAGRALTQYGQDIGSEEYGNYISGLSGLVSGGQNAAGGLSNLTAGLGSDRASAILGTGANKANVRTGGLSAITGSNTEVGQAQAGGVLGAANARAAGANNLLSLLTTGARMALGGGFGGATPTTMY